MEVTQVPSHTAVHFVPLAEVPEAIPVLARWYFDQWGHERPGATLAAVETKVRVSAQTSAIPMSLLALTGNGQIIGAAQLKIREMEIFPEKEHWLGGVYVSASHRGAGIATKLVEQMMAVSRRVGVTTLYLQTEDLSGGLYARLGWRPEQTVRSLGKIVLVMRRDFG